MGRKKKFDPVVGGEARAEKLSKSELSAIARRAADARWNIPQATHDGTFPIAGQQIECAVLNDGRRILGQQSFMSAIGRTGKPTRAEQGEDVSSFTTPAFLDADNLKSYISEDLRSPSRCIVYRTKSGRRAFGYEARLLPLVCDVYLAARKAGVLTEKQTHIADACEILVRGLAQTGIVALVDEATRFQEVRDRHALQAILDQYLRREFAAWAKRFPDEFYKEMFRLRGWTWKHMNPAGGPRCVASYTKDLIYCRLAPGILAELEERNPVQESGRRKAAHHQWLTVDIGHPALAQHLHAVIALMRVSPDGDWCGFMRMLDRAFPRRGHSIQMDLFDLDPTLGSSTEPQPPSEQSPPAVQG